MSGEQSILLDHFSSKAIEQTVNTKKAFFIHCNVADNLFIYNVENCIHTILKNKNLTQFHSCLTFVIKELIDNANKANLKRVFFQKNNFNINDRVEYEKGVTLFTQSLRAGEKNLYHRIIEDNFYIRVFFIGYADSELRIEIVNNSLLTEEEKKRVSEKQKNYLKIQSIHEKSLGEMDETEGAGMGLFLSLKVLHRSGISPSALKINESAGCTVAALHFNYCDILNSQICLPKE